MLFHAERDWHSVYRELLRMVPGLEDRIQDFDELEVVADHVSALLKYPLPFWLLCVLQLCKGGASARGDDTKGLKGAIIDWITPKGDILTPSLSRNSKLTRGFHHETTGTLLCPTFLDWSDHKCVNACFNKFHTDLCLRTKSGLQTGEIAATGDSWPMFLYADSIYDENDPWKGLFRSQIMLNVSVLSSYCKYHDTDFTGVQICLHLTKLCW